VDTPPDGSKFVLADIEVLPLQPAEPRAKRLVKSFKTDWSAMTAYSRKLGEQGERFVLELERRRLLLYSKFGRRLPQLFLGKLQQQTKRVPVRRYRMSADSALCACP
jgi:hypothetical protein